MNLLQEIQKKAIIKRPEVRTGYTVRVHQRIQEGEKTRTQIFEGLVIKVNSGFGADKTITVRKVTGGIGVEKVFPLYSTNVTKIEVKKTSKVRRSKLYYMRERFGKSARMKDTLVSNKDQDEAIEELAKTTAEAEENEETNDTTENTAVEETAEATPEVVEEKVEEKEEPKEEEAKEEEAKEEEAKEEEAKEEEAEKSE